MMDSAPPKQAACLTCRRGKMKCNRIEGSAICTRCERNQTECVIPEYHVGRHKGVKNKRTGLEKAVHQIEEALRKSQSLPSTRDGAPGGSDLHELLAQSYNTLPETQGHVLVAEPTPANHSSSPYSSSTGRHSRFEISDQAPHEDHTMADGHRVGTQDLADAENPLQLLAQTSELMRPTPQPRSMSAQMKMPVTSASALTTQDAKQSSDVNFFFGHSKLRLDIDGDLDPVNIGLVTESEVDTLFEYFFQNLAHTRWGIDPVIHTPAFVRSRSAFLFTSICAASALFIPSTAALSKRLSIHSRKLLQNIVSSRCRSVEIVLSLMLNIPWMSPGEHWADDETSTYLSMALTVAMDLSLDKVIRQKSPSRVQELDNIASGDCIDAVRALELDGFDTVDPASGWGRQLLRRRERAWLALFVLERGVCLARGRRYTVPTTPLIETCDRWHICDISDIWDGSIVSMAVLRRELAGLISKVRSICDHHQANHLGGQSTVRTIKEEIEAFFDQWYNTWPFQIGDRREFRLPPYVEIMASHTRLSLYSSVVNQPTAPLEVRNFFRAAGLASALNVMRAAVQGESQLKSMPNNTAIMISFAACFALRLSMAADENKAGLAPSVRTLIEEAADVLERIGSAPEHRKGASALFAKQLRNVVVLARGPAMSEMCGQMNSGPHGHSVSSRAPMYDQVSSQPANANTATNADTFLSPAPFIFSGMSNEEINEAIEGAGQGLGMSWADFQFGDGPNLDWLAWPM